MGRYISSRAAFSVQKRLLSNLAAIDVSAGPRPQCERRLTLLANSVSIHALPSNLLIETCGREAPAQTAEPQTLDTLVVGH